MSQGRSIRTLLERPSDVSLHFMSKWINLFLLPGGIWNRRQLGKLLRGTLRRSSKNVINTKNCSAFGILVKINIDIHTDLNLFEGETSVTAKMVLKKHWPFLNVEETKILILTYDRPFHMSQIHINLPKDQTEPSGQNAATGNWVLLLMSTLLAIHWAVFIKALRLAPIPD